MNRYKMFVAIYSYTLHSLSSAEKEYMVVTLNLEGESLYKWVSTHPTFEEAKAACDTDEDGTVRIVECPKVIARTYSISCEFDTEQRAQEWLNSQKISRGHETFDCRIEEVVIDQDDLENYEFKPTYTVEAYVAQVKRITIDVDTAETEFEDCEDEYDVEQVIRDKINAGEYEDDLDYADVWDSDINDVEVTED